MKVELYPTDNRGRKLSYIDHIPRPAQQPVGYCWNATHYGRLSKEHIKKHGCLKKKCQYLEKYTDTATGYWEDKEKSDANKKEYQKLRKNWLAGKLSTQEYLSLRKELEKCK